MKKLILILSIVTPAIHAWKDFASFAREARKSAKQEQRKIKVQHYLDHQFNYEEPVIHHPNQPALSRTPIYCIVGAYCVIGCYVYMNSLQNNSQQK